MNIENIFYDNDYLNWKVMWRRKLYEICVEFIKEMNCKEGIVWIEIIFKNIEVEFIDK